MIAKLTRTVTIMVYGYQWNRGEPGPGPERGIEDRDGTEEVEREQRGLHAPSPPTHLTEPGE